MTPLSLALVEMLFAAPSHRGS